MPVAGRGARRGIVMAALPLLLLLALEGASVQRPPPAKPSLAEISESFEALAARVNPAVVSIFATGYRAGQGTTSSRELIAESRSRGSGVILTEDGYVVTNAHVVAGARRVRLLLARREQGSSILGTRGETAGAQIVGVDLETDLAVLKMEGTGLPYLELGDSEALRPGELVFAFGSPLGLDNSVTMGVVSAVARQLRPEDPMIYIQTDASINPGNSGGPLVDAAGKVVGVNTMMLSQSGGSEGLSFAAPSNIVRTVFDQIRKTGRVHRGEIGVTAQTISPLMARGLDLPQDWGAILSDVSLAGPAAAAGLAPGDIVVSLDGKTVENARQLAVNVYQRSISDRVRIEVLRGAERLSFEVEVVGRKDHPNRFAGMVHPDRNLVPQLGILGIDLDRDMVPFFTGLRRGSGVIVAAQAAEATPMEGEGLQPGDVIYSVNRLDVSSLNELKAAIARYRPGDAVVIQVQRDRTLRYVTLEMN
jgi:serine protease Do